jgi:type VI protein secretion system component Hcp
MKTIICTALAALFMSLAGNVSSKAFAQSEGRETYYTYKLKDVIVTSYVFEGNAAVDTLLAELGILGYTEVEWTFMTLFGANPYDKDGMGLGFKENAAGDRLPAEGVTLGYTEVEWTFMTPLLAFFQSH